MKFLYSKKGEKEETSSIFEIRRGVGNKETKNEISFGDTASALSSLVALGLVEVFWKGKIKIYKISEDGKRVLKNKTFFVKKLSKFYYYKSI